MTDEGIGAEDMNGEDDKVGYGKPPRKRRFQPGQSGNPKGRPRGSRGLRTDLDVIMAEPIRLNKTGQRLTMQQIVLKSLAQKAATGNVQAAGLILQHVIAAFGFEDRRGKRQTLTAQDEAILQAMLASGSIEDLGTADDGKDESHGGDHSSDA